MKAQCVDVVEGLKKFETLPGIEAIIVNGYVHLNILCKAIVLAASVVDDLPIINPEFSSFLAQLYRDLEDFLLDENDRLIPEAKAALASKGFEVEMEEIHEYRRPETMCVVFTNNGKIVIGKR